jgi:hypothetical protein
MIVSSVVLVGRQWVVGLEVLVISIQSGEIPLEVIQ